MDNFEQKMREVFTKDFTPPIKYKKAVETAIENAQYSNENNKLFFIYNIKNMVASFIIGIILLSGVTYASIKLYENIWKNPNETTINEFLINDDDKKAVLDETTTLINLATEEFKRIGYDTLKLKVQNILKIRIQMIFYYFKYLPIMKKIKI